ncbi:MAG: hypothetical protein COU07_03260 [Candidatus Harrisonbacteria bacterium CG10_big_fil_rev_8_21_14_0_10_40_38]|uniref:Uncharacterized protein n=1 Tax=Candidatus Harrisonbacteria bacterium CG10_big_fil_rev_8_21_14_0_10_40_38 TaxID=1974583 RepID=A0A2H0UR62_9BACT|nr:MAG: hypothetical protein COU07_03260 [Candidatus Harrisonbacteria bacterium CG10_big_fil_rev_8_21_14_0_10_40_38]
MVDRTGKKVELAARPALTGFFLHQFYIITPDFPNQINIQGLPAGTEQFTIGGYNRGGELFGRPFGIGNRLITEIGYEGGIENTDTPYLTGEKQVTDRTTITPPSGVSDAEFINNLGNAARTTLSQPYASGGSTFSFGGANSNNIVVSLAQRTGVVSQVTSFNPKNFNFSPGNQGYWIQSARQSIQARLNYISAQLEAIRQLLLTLR